MILKLGYIMRHWLLEYYQVCSNADPGLTLVILQQGQVWSFVFVWENASAVDFQETIEACESWYI